MVVIFLSLFVSYAFQGYLIYHLSLCSGLIQKSQIKTQTQKLYFFVNKLHTICTQSFSMYIVSHWLCSCTLCTQCTLQGRVYSIPLAAWLYYVYVCTLQGRASVSQGLHGCTMCMYVPCRVEPRCRRGWACSLPWPWPTPRRGPCTSSSSSQPIFEN